MRYPNRQSRKTTPVTYHHRQAKYTQQKVLCRQQGRHCVTKQCQPRAAPAKLSVMTRGKIKALHDKNSLKEFMTTKPALRIILEGILKLRKKTKPSVKPKERINHTRLIVKKRRENQTRQNQQSGRNQCTPSTIKSSGLNVPIERHGGLDQKA